MVSSTTDLARSLATTSPPPRHDPLAQFGAAPPRPPVDLRRAVHTFWAFGLIAAGVGAGVWLAVLIQAAVFHPQTVGLLDRFAPPSREDLTLTLPAGKVELPPAGMSVIAYLFLIVLTTIGARLTAVMIKQGVSLLRAPADAADASRDGREETEAGLRRIDPAA